MFDGTTIDSLLRTVERAERTARRVAPLEIPYLQNFDIHVDNPEQFARMLTALDPFVFAAPLGRGRE